MVENAHVEPRGPASKRLANGAEADNTEGFTVHTLPQQRLGKRPVVVAKQALRRAGATARSQQQRHSEVGGIFGHPRSIAHSDPTGPRGGEVNVVDADPDIGDKSHA